MHLGLGGAAGAGAVALLQAAQTVVLLDLAAGVADADAAVVEFGAAAVFADGGGEDVDVVVRVAYGDPAAGQVVTGRGDAGGFDDALGDLAPLGVGEVAVLGCGADGAVPDVVGDRLAELAVAQADGLVEVAGECGEGGVVVAAGVGHAEHGEARDDVRVEVFVVAAGAVEVGEQAAGVGPGRFDGGDHADGSVLRVGGLAQGLGDQLQQVVEFVEALAYVGWGEVAVEGAGDLVDVDADPVELAQDLGAEHVGAAAVLGQGQVGGEPAGDEGEDDVGGEAGVALVAVLGGGLLEAGVLVAGEAQRADAVGALVPVKRRIVGWTLCTAGSPAAGSAALVRGAGSRCWTAWSVSGSGPPSAPASWSGAPWRWAVSATPGAETPEDRP